MRKVKFFMIAAVLLSFSVLLGMPSASFAAPQGEPFVVGYVGAVASPGTKPCMDIQKMAAEEINAAGGIMGRPLKYIVMDGKGDTSLSVEAFRKLVIEDKAKFVSVEGRTEICLAVQEASGSLSKEYPHILVFNGPMGAELTARILDEAPKYNHCFRDWDPEPAHYAQQKYFFCKTIPEYQKGNKLAILWEDLAWTTEWRKGISYINLPTWEKLAKDCGLQVVYSKAVKPRGTLYFPILQQIAQSKGRRHFLHQLLVYRYGIVCQAVGRFGCKGYRGQSLWRCRPDPGLLEDDRRKSAGRYQFLYGSGFDSPNSNDRSAC